MTNQLLDWLAWIDTDLSSLIYWSAILGIFLALMALDAWSSGGVRAYLFGSIDDVSPSASGLVTPEEEHAIPRVADGDTCVSRGGGARRPDLLTAARQDRQDRNSSGYGKAGRQCLPPDPLVDLNGFHARETPPLDERRRQLDAATQSDPDLVVNLLLFVPKGQYRSFR